jgi:hypothetical protein
MPSGVHVAASFSFRTDGQNKPAFLIKNAHSKPFKWGSGNIFNLFDIVQHAAMFAPPGIGFAVTTKISTQKWFDPC